MGNPKVNNGSKTVDANEKTISGQAEKSAATAAQSAGYQVNEVKADTSPDQDRYTRGIRDLKQNESGDGSFVEAEQLPSDRRDPEESRYNEAGQRVVTQGDLDEKTFSSKRTNPEGSKISNSQPQTAL